MTETPAITVRDWAETRAALETARSHGRAVFLCSPPGASSWLGPGYWAALQQKARAEFPEVDFILALDCGEAAGDAMAALRAGITHVAFGGDQAILDKLREIATEVGAKMLDRCA